MELSICSLSSGSSGNCYVVFSETTHVLVDAGISLKKIKEGLSAVGASLDDIDSVLVTHSHSDHTKALPMLAKHGKMFRANASTFEELDFKDYSAFKQTFRTGDSFEIGDIHVETFAVSHDTADPVGFAFECNGKRIAIVTDTGIVTDSIYRQIQLADILVLESNHDESMLRIGPYPWFLKQRILGEQGHLSNDAAASALTSVLSAEKESGLGKFRTVLLAHLSKENNFPEMALATMENYIQAADISPKSVRVNVLPRMIPSPVYEI